MEIDRVKLVKRLAFAFVILLFFAMASMPILFKDKEESFEKTKEELEYYLYDVSIIGHEDGDKAWLLQANRVIDQGKDRSLFHGLEKGEIYNSAGELKYHLQAERGEYDRKSENFHLQDNVVVTSSDGDVMVTDQLWYENKMKKMRSSSVQVQTDDGLVYAQEMQADVEDEVFTFSGDVKMEFTIGSEDQEEREGAEE